MRKEWGMEIAVNILGFAGSLRKSSYNKSLLRAALDLVPQNARLEIFDLEGITLFNQDLEQSERSYICAVIEDSDSGEDHGDNH